MQFDISYLIDCGRRFLYAKIEPNPTSFGHFAFSGTFSFDRNNLGTTSQITKHYLALVRRYQSTFGLLW